MLSLQQTKDGWILTIRAHAGARRNAIGGVQAGQLKISVTQKPEKGKANQAIAALLAQRLSIAKNQITLVGGPTNSRKRFLISGSSEQAIHALSSES